MNMSFTQCGVPPSLQSSISHLTNFDSILNNAPICRIITAYSNTQNVNLKMFFFLFSFILNKFQTSHAFLLCAVLKCYTEDVPPALTYVLKRFI